VALLVIASLWAWQPWRPRVQAHITSLAVLPLENLSGDPSQGALEDRFFARVFLGSGFLYVAMMFTSGAVAEAVLTLLATGSNSLMTSGSYDLAREEVFRITSIYATKMAGVFMISTSTIFTQTRIVPRWITFLGYALALVSLVECGSYEISGDGFSAVGDGQ
jgi:hypothetical protein